jgi:hypothetical protein
MANKQGNEMVLVTIFRLIATAFAVLAMIMVAGAVLDTIYHVSGAREVAGIAFTGFVICFFLFAGSGIVWLWRTKP